VNERAIDWMLVHPIMSRVPAIRPAPAHESGRAKAVRIVLEVSAAVIWLCGAAMTVVVLGFRKYDEPVSDIAPAVALYGFIPIVVSAVLFSFADRRIRTAGRTVAYVFGAWLAVIAWTAWETL
jgi:hypothetical protein